MKKKTQERKNCTMLTHELNKKTPLRNDKHRKQILSKTNFQADRKV